MIAVTHLITTLEAAGAELMLARLASAMNREEFDTRVISLVPGGRAQQILEQNGVAVMTLGMSRGRLNPAGVVRLVAELHRNPPDILQTWLYHADLLGLVAGRLTGVGSILWNVRCSEIHHASRGTRMVRRLLRLLSSMPRAIVSNSQAAVELHAGYGYSAKRWVVIPNGFDIDRFHPDPEARRRMRRRLGISEADFVIGTVGRADPLKDYGTFLDAGCRLLEARRDAGIKFILGGRGIEASGVADRLDPECRSRFHFPGEIEDVPGIMSALDVFTLTSVAEGFPNVVAEAMACGIPCVVTDVGDSARIVGNAGIVVPPASPDAIVAGWQTLMDDPEDRLVMGKAARVRIVDQFSLASVVGRYEELYREVAAVRGVA